jgi:uncharacterized membrane protein
MMNHVKKAIILSTIAILLMIVAIVFNFIGKQGVALIIIDFAIVLLNVFLLVWNIKRYKKYKMLTKILLKMEEHHD